MNEVEKFELRMQDLTPEAQQKFREFVGRDWTDKMETEPIWGISKRPKNGEIEDLPDVIRGVVDQLIEHNVPNVNEVIAKLMERFKSGAEIQGLAIDKETGEVIFLDGDGSVDVDTKEGFHRDMNLEPPNVEKIKSLLGSLHEAMGEDDPDKCKDCPKTDCDKHPDNPASSFGSHSGDRSWN